MSNQDVLEKKITQSLHDLESKIKEFEDSQEKIDALESIENIKKLLDLD